MTQEEYVNHLIQRIHNHPCKVFLTATGGGTRALSWLMERGNASKTIVGAFVPYDTDEHVDFLGRRPDKFVDAVDSRMLALTSYQRAAKRHPLNAIGIGASSSLQKLELEDDLVTHKPERENRQHEIHVSMHTIGETASWSFVARGPMCNPENLMGYDASNPGENSVCVRLYEEQVNSLMIIKALAYACGENLDLSEDDLIVFRSAKAKDIHPRMSELIQRQIPFLPISLGEGHYECEEEFQRARDFWPRLIVSGSFNPIHLGHELMADLASKIVNDDYSYFELPISNPDKGWLDFITIQDRLQQFQGGTYRRILLTNAATFLEKSRLFPDATFAIGMDTFVRIIDPKYYPTMTINEVAAQFVLNRSRFLVFGRKDRTTGRFIDSPEEITSNLGIVTPQSFLDISRFIPQNQFSVDMASSDIRKGTN